MEEVRRREEMAELAEVVPRTREVAAMAVALEAGMARLKAQGRHRLWAMDKVEGPAPPYQAAGVEWTMTGRPL